MRDREVIADTCNSNQRKEFLALLTFISFVIWGYGCCQNRCRSIWWYYKSKIQKAYNIDRWTTLESHFRTFILSFLDLSYFGVLLVILLFSLYYANPHNFICMLIYLFYVLYDSAVVMYAQRSKIALRS